MRAMPVKLIYGEGYINAPVNEATHVKLKFPGPAGVLHLPVILSGKRDGTNCWTWNGDTERPTLHPSVLTEGTERITDEEYAILMAGGKIEPRTYRSHAWVNDGQAHFLDDCSHDMRNKTIDMLEVFL